MQKVTHFLLLCIVFLSSASFFYPAGEKIKWLTVEEMKQAYKKQPRPILFDVYTDWCGWCKVMDKDTYSKDKVASYINTHYYAVKYNAESTEPVEFAGKKYLYNADSRSNGFANYLLFDQMAFPTTVFLSGINARPAPLAGFLKPKELEAPLKYFGDGAFEKQNYNEFMQNFKPSW